MLWERGNPNEGESHAAVTWGRVEGDDRVRLEGVQCTRIQIWVELRVG